MSAVLCLLDVTLSYSTPLTFSLLLIYYAMTPTRLYEEQMFLYLQA